MEDRPEPVSRPEHRIDPALRRRLIKRIALAGVVIAALLGGLAVIDRYYVPPPSTAPRALTASLPPPSLKPPEAPPVAPPPAVPAEPERSSSPSITRPAGPRSSEAAKPAEPSKPVATGVVAPAPQTKAAPAKAPAAENNRPSARPPAGRATRGKSAQKQYVFQMGVFGDVANAQHLNEKLKDAGVPSRIEARVQVGPFKTRKEAEEARKKLAALGIKPGTLMPVRK